MERKMKASSDAEIYEDEEVQGKDSSAKSMQFEMEPLTNKKLGQDVITDVFTDEETLHPLLIEEDSWLSPKLSAWLYPPGVPRECQLLRKENLAVPACYLLVGILQGLSGPLINVYPLDLGATQAQQVTVSSIRSLPASFKLIFGFISDNFPLSGYRRKSYMLIGWILASASFMTLIWFSDLSGVVDGHVPADAPSIGFLSVSLLGFGTGFWLADVMGDSIVAEKAKLEIEKGHLQSTCYACRFFGVMVAAPCSTYIYSAMGPYYVISLMAMLPLVILPTLYHLSENRHAEVKSTHEQCQEIWKTVCSRAVWQPMGFVYLYNLLQVSNGAWRDFSKVVLGFTSSELNIILIVAYVLLYLGVLAYKYFFISWSWRSVYIFTTLLNGVFSALQVLLIYKITFGLSPFLFALGDDAFSEFISGIQFLVSLRDCDSSLRASQRSDKHLRLQPTTIMMVHLCPAGSEGASYAMFTTVNNSALNLSSAISTTLLSIWDVSKETLSKGIVTGLVSLTVLTTCCQMSGILFVGLLPRTKDDLAKLNHETSKSSVGGTIFLSITFLSILYALTVGVLNIVTPGWAGES
jgi:uncharacterized membrane protein YagU involved in acid resistance